MMKFLFLICFSFSAFAQSYFRVEDIKCEGLPDELAKQCLILATDSQRTQIFILSKLEYTLSSINLAKGDFLILKKQDYKKATDIVTRIHARRALAHNPHHISDIFFLKYRPEQISFNSVQEQVVLTCHNDSFLDHDGFMFGKFFLKAKLIASQNNSFRLENTQLRYFLSLHEDFSSEWDSGSFEEGNFLNRFNYRPYTYQGFIKFPDLFANQLSGKIDLLLPREQIKHSDFDGVVIFSHIKEHFGTTFSVHCQKELP